jgi:hypothetical protein
MPIRWSRVIAGIAVKRTNAVAEGRAPGALRFDAEDTRYVIALSAKPDGIFDGLSRFERRQKFRITEGEVAKTRCTIAHPGGSTSRVRGDRQTVRETVGNVYATVGEFDGKGGTTTVACRFDPPEDLLGTRTETPLMVHALSSLRSLSWGLLLGVFVFAGLGTLLILRGTVWRDR